MWDVGTLVCAWLLSSVNTLLLVTTYRAQVPSPSPPVSRCRASCCWGRGWGCCSPPPPPARWWPPCRATAASRGGSSSWWPSSSPPPWCGSWVSSCWGAAVMQLVSIQLCVCRRGGGGGLGVRGAARGTGVHRGLQTQQALPRPGEGSHWPWSHWPWSHCSHTTALVPRHPAPALEPGDRPPPHLPRHQRQDVPRHRRGDCSPVEPQLLQVRGCPLR